MEQLFPGLDIHAQPGRSTEKHHQNTTATRCHMRWAAALRAAFFGGGRLFSSGTAPENTCWQADGQGGTRAEAPPSASPRPRSAASSKNGCFPWGSSSCSKILRRAALARVSSFCTAPGFLPSMGGDLPDGIAVIIPQEQHLPIGRRQPGHGIRQAAIPREGQLHAPGALLKRLRTEPGTAAEYVDGFALCYDNDVGAGFWTPDFRNFFKFSIMDTNAWWTASSADPPPRAKCAGLCRT